MLKRPLVRKPMGHPLGLNPAGVLLFRNRALGGAAESTVLLRATAKASTPFHPHPSIHPSLFAFSWFEGAETAPGPQTNGPPLGPESCWGSAVSQPCPRRCFCSRIHGVAQSRGQSFHIPPYSTPIHPSIHPSLCFYSWFEGAETAPGPQTNGPPLGPESCWGSAVPQPCPGRCFCSRIHGAAHSGCAMLSMAVSTVLFRQLNPQCCTGPLYFNPSTHYVNPSTHPRPKLPPPPTHPSLCEGAETAPGPQTNGPPLGPESCWGSAVSQPCPRRCSRIHGAAMGHGQSFHPIPPPSIHPSISLCF